MTDTRGSRSMAREVRTPSIRPLTGTNLEQVVSDLVKWVHTRDGRFGDGMDRALTMRDVQAASFPWDKTAVPTSTTVIDTGGSGGTSGLPAPPDVVPPAPANLQVLSGLTSVILRWEMAYVAAHDYFEVWRSSTASLAEAVLVATTPSPLYADAPPSGTTFYYWVRARTVYGRLGAYNAVGGTPGALVASPDRLLELLANQISESELASALSARVDLVDGAATVPGSVDARLATQLSSVTSSYTAADATVFSNAQAYAQSWAYSKAQADSAISTATNAVSARLDSGGDTYNAIVTAQSNAATALTNAGTAQGTANATATNLTTLASRLESGNLAAFTAYLQWDFNGTKDGWVELASIYGSTTAGTTALLATLDASGHCLIGRDLAVGTPDRFAGATQTIVRARVRRAAGTPTWHGVLYFGNENHGESGLHYKHVPEPQWGPGGWATVEWDMAALTVGGADWLTSAVITRLRLDLSVAGSPPGSWEIDWIAVGARASGGVSASLQQEMNTRAALDGSVHALYTLRAEVSDGGRPVVGGFGLSATSTQAAGPRIDFGVRADQFWVTAPGVSDKVPFVVRTTTTTENGQTIAPGVYIDSANIVNLSVLYARIATLVAGSIAASDISVARLVGGEMQVGAYLRTANFIPDTAGLYFDHTGYFEAQNAKVRGHIEATSGIFSGSLSGASITGATGTFSGSLSGASITGATGTFSGALNVQSAPSGQRMEITTSAIRGYFASGQIAFELSA